MSETITARDANHHFSRLLREVESGKEFVVTRNGVPVARIVPERLPDGTRKLTEAQEAALARTLERARVGWPIEHISRDEIYDNARSWMTRVK